ICVGRLRRSLRRFCTRWWRTTRLAAGWACSSAIGLEMRPIRVVVLNDVWRVFRRRPLFGRFRGSQRSPVAKTEPRAANVRATTEIVKALGHPGLLDLIGRTAFDGQRRRPRQIKSAVLVLPVDKDGHWNDPARLWLVLVAHPLKH